LTARRTGRWWRRQVGVGTGDGLGPDVAVDGVAAGGIDAELFRALLRRQAASVVVVTAATDPPVGFTATSFTSVSLHPPLVSFNLDRASSSWSALLRAGYVGVHILGAGQESLARRFATTGVDRFAEPTPWRPGPHGVPLLDDAPAWLICRVVSRLPAGDHMIVLAQPLLGEHVAGADQPLIYHMGRYLTVPPPAGDGAAPPSEEPNP
jgi:flavin reductase (DIM6/NTAB) family NADH-FMN oxidoreductase RutF